MELNANALLPIVAKLCDCYTSKESSSVTYETAHMLMEAVIYCINENFSEKEKTALLGDEELEYSVLYEKGHQIVIDKVYQAKAIYERIIENFRDYNCENYRATILNGIPQFFIRYDTKFCPQNHILTLDYMAMQMDSTKHGVDRILEYLIGIEKEKIFLNEFEDSSITRLLEKINIEYQQLFLDNICSVVVLQAIGCVIADKPIVKLQLDHNDCKDIILYFKGDSYEKIEYKLDKMIQMIANICKDPMLSSYLAHENKNYAARIIEGIKNEAICNIFLFESI